jgi:rSAM/selenodomain-associated transferase 2
VDGGSNDGTLTKARRAGARVSFSPKGRAKQMNAGAKKARGDIFLFLHADSRLPDGWQEKVRSALTKANKKWGAFESISIDAHPWTAWLLRQSVALRTRLQHRPYGDQALFMQREAFKSVGGFPDDWPLLEDVELVRRLKRAVGSPALIRTPVQTSGRRWRALGLLRTTFLNQCILLGHACGVPLSRLADVYKNAGKCGSKQKSMRRR